MGIVAATDMLDVDGFEIVHQICNFPVDFLKRRIFYPVFPIDLFDNQLTIAGNFQIRPVQPRCVLQCQKQTLIFRVIIGALPQKKTPGQKFLSFGVRDDHPGCGRPWIAS
ncbi:MAG: hypothetical protein BWY71_00037 [Planctomycetes bacterium ADurb.Bin412]|nr:MAG: hypothetical protein BWY71_00037 [Planctomycetes bacterium ADurb.Bin412]